MTARNDHDKWGIAGIGCDGAVFGHEQQGKKTMWTGIICQQFDGQEFTVFRARWDHTRNSGTLRK